MLGWQASFQKEESFADRFMKLLRSGLAGGRFHVRYDEEPAHPEAWGHVRDGDYLNPQGKRIGWLNLSTGEVVLLPGEVHAAIRNAAADSGHHFSASTSETWRALADAGLCKTDKPDAGRTRERPTVKRPAYDGASRFVVLNVEAIRPSGEKPRGCADESEDDYDF